MISTIVLVIVRNLEIYFLRKFLLLTKRVRGKIWSFSMSGCWLGGWGKAGKKANLIQLELTIGWAWQLWNIFCKIGPHCVQCIFAFDTIWSSYQGTVWDRIKFYFITMAERFIMCIVKTLVSYFLHYTMKTEKQSL